MHTQNQPIDQAPRQSSKAGATGVGEHPQTRTARCSGDTTPAADQGASAHSPIAFSSAPRSCNTPRPLAVWKGKESELPGPGMLTSRTLLRPPHSATSLVGLRALGCPEAGLERKAARVPPCARRDTGLDGKPRGSHPALEGVGC